MQHTEARRTTNDNLRESEERLSVTLDSIGDAVIVTNADTTVTRMNPVAEQLTGWSSKDAVGLPIKDIFNILNQETRQKSTIPVMATLAKGLIQGLANHTILVSRDGKERSISDSCAPIRNRAGTVFGAILVFRDVTKAYEIEQALHDSSTQIRTILDTVVDGVITFRADDGIIASSNSATARMFGCPADDLLGTDLSALIPELYSDNSDKSLEYFRASDENRQNGIVREVTGHGKDGRIFPLEISVGEMTLGNRRYFSALLRDISVRRRAEEEAIRDNALKNAVFRSQNFSCIATDTRGAIQIFNVGAETMLGYAAGDVIHKMTTADLLDPREVAERAQSLSEELKSRIEPGFEALVLKASRGIEDIYEISYLRKDGSRFPSMVSVTALQDTRGVIIGYLLIGIDNTARKKVELERETLNQALQEKNDELQIARIVADRANHAKSDFLSNMSHELRTPLSAILGFAQLMDTGTPGPSASQKKSIDQILKAGWYLLDLINEILDLALIESGKISLSLEPVSVAEILEECRIMIAIQAEKRNIAISFSEFDARYMVRADRIRLKQIFINLLSNAIKYNRDGGTISVDFMLMPPDVVRINVRDTGIGLSPEKITQLFEPFNRLGQETLVEEGTGIGLVVSKRLIELMGGIIGVDSSVGEGSTFWVEMSIIEENGDTEKKATKEALKLDGSTSRKTRTLLYIEDNPANMMLVEDIVARIGDLRIICATNGIRGVETAAARLPDVILMDINLPGMNGIDALKTLRKNPETAHIPIIALSANAIPRDIERGLAAGFSRYLTKPIKIDEFMAALDYALNASEKKNDR